MKSLQREFLKIIGCSVIVLLFFAQLALGEWKENEVRQLNGRAAQITLPAKSQIVTERWNRVAAVPYLVYMLDKDRLLMLVACDDPHQAMVLRSDDHGASWSSPHYVHTNSAGQPEAGWGTGLTYLGNGKLLLMSGGKWVWFSSDHGETWTERVPFPPASNGVVLDFGWDPLLVDKNPQNGTVERLIAGGWHPMPGYSQGGIRFSADVGLNWGELIDVPEWWGVSEVAFVRAQNGNIVAGCRTDFPKRFRKTNFDHYEGLGTSVSEDNGRTWSKLWRLYDWGRMHPSLVVLPKGEIVMTYVVRKGYPDTEDGFPQFGIEAVVSYDNGQTWDLDHRYILANWSGIRKGPNAWYASSQATSTVLLPDGSLLTAFGTGYRSVDPTGKGKPSPRDVGLIQWRLNKGKVNSDRTIASGSYDTILRNEFNPDPKRGKITLYCLAQPGKKNIAVPNWGAEARASANDGDPAYVFQNPYNCPVLTLETMPAWMEIHWPKEQRIDEIHIHPGAPAWARRPITECVPIDYRVQYQNGDQWLDLIPPVTNAKRYAEFYGINQPYYVTQDREFVYIHTFPEVAIKALRLSISRSSDSGQRTGSGDRIVVREDQRETCLRRIEVFEAHTNKKLGRVQRQRDARHEEK
ncbi:MAG: exo-alpha-sialidase [Acidobacteria bacterium]|nr:exo-alpha-sialidase [Acidobacteriota bacterium]